MSVAVKSLLVKILLRVILPLVVILLIVFGVSYFGFKQVNGIWLFESMRIERNVKQVVEEFMEAGVARNIEEGYACKYYKSSFEEGIVELIERKYDAVFAGYKSLTINSMSWQSDMTLAMVGLDDEEDGGIDRCGAKGDITYTSDLAFGKVKRFKASMMKENGIWKIGDLRIGGHVLIRGIIPDNYYVEVG